MHNNVYVQEVASGAKLVYTGMRSSLAQRAVSGLDVVACDVLRALLARARTLDHEVAATDIVLDIG